MDRILLKGLHAEAVIGTLADERTMRQPLIFDVELRGDFSRAGRTDSLQDAVDYCEVEHEILRIADANAFHLLERLTHVCAEALLERFPQLDSVLLRAHKPNAPVLSSGVAVEVERFRMRPQGHSVRTNP